MSALGPQVLLYRGTAQYQLRCERDLKPKRTSSRVLDGPEHVACLRLRQVARDKQGQDELPVGRPLRVGQAGGLVRPYQAFDSTLVGTLTRPLGSTRR
ncbi:MAG TPA: hypothetical protein PKB06_02315, partial [Actinotalea sp.]|nr:hypothetical protein [Actinotalea sp.]